MSTPDSSSGRSPAERYAAARRRGRTRRAEQFATGYDFGLDEFQLQACRAVEAGHGVLVAAPTGAGKTVVGEFAVYLALESGRKCFYTTPIKALSNQKFHDLVARHGAANVGLLTGDVAINGEAPVVVMTTEVLRNMLYAQSSSLTGLAYVVMDEVHYLADRARGAVWEEVILGLPESVSVVSLSATVSNAEEFGQWLVAVRGDTEVIVTEHRPVPLSQHMLVGRELMDLFDDRPGRDGEVVVSRALVRAVRMAGDVGGARARHPGQGRPRVRVPTRAQVLSGLDAEGLLPAITFVFSRAGCEAALTQCEQAGLRLTTEAEAVAIRDVVERRCAELDPADLRVLGYHAWLASLQHGLAAHHAGMLPTFKETVEELFSRGLVKAVFATETLALGINMPARSVVLERLVKWNGQAHVDITAGEYTQLTGRAGRRGIDIEGHAVVLWQPGLDPEHVAGLAGTRTYPLRSSFSPSYNMAVNLVASIGADRARELLATSFAQFQADRSVVGLTRQVARNTEALAGYAEAMTCDKGDFAAYITLRRRIAERESALARQGSASRRAQLASDLERLRPGDVVRIGQGRRGGLAVVLDPGTNAPGEIRPLVLTVDRWAGRVTSSDFVDSAAPLTRMRLPKHVNHRSPQVRRDLAAALRTAVDRAGVEPAGRARRARSTAADDPILSDLRAALRAHPCHGCPDREAHARWGERYNRLAAENEKVARRVEGRTGSVARVFDTVCGLLVDRGYLTGTGDELLVSPAGRRLARVYGDSDLLVAECLRHGVWQDLDAPGLAAVVAAAGYSARREAVAPPRMPTPAVDAVIRQMHRIWVELHEAEDAVGVELVAEPDPGFSAAAHAWAAGQPLSRVLDATADTDPMPAGDFVRWARQVVDLLGQVAVAAGDDPVAGTARAAARVMSRGVVSGTAAGGL